MNYDSIFVFLASISLFCALKDIRINYLRKIILLISKRSYGIYLIHFFILTNLETLSISANHGPAWVMIPVTAVLALFLSLLVVSIIRKIPYLEKCAG